MSELARLQNEIDELKDLVEELARQDRPQWHFERLDNLTDWFDETKGTADDGVIDLSADFGVPANIKAVMLRMDIIDPTVTAVKIKTSSGASTSMLAYTGYGSTHDEWISLQGIVPCDSNGDVYIEYDDTIRISLYILAYYI
jgi:hypothetical protein